jgi:hypothetical protein
MWPFILTGAVCLVAGGFIGSLAMTLARVAGSLSLQDRHERLRALVGEQRSMAIVADSAAAAAFCDRMLDVLDGVEADA